MPMQSYRALNRIHLPPPEEGSIDKDDVVKFDGKLLILHSGEERKLMHPSGIAAAIKARWLVPVEDTESVYVPQSGGVEIHAAQSTGDKRERINVMTVQDEERSVGTREAVREAGNVHGTHQKAPVQRDTGDGKVVGRFKNSAQAAPVEIGKNDRQVKSSLDNKSKVEVERFGTPVRSATGDGSQFANEGVEVVGGASSVGGQEEGVVVAKVGGGDTKPSQLDRNSGALESALRKWSDTGETWDGKPVHMGELSVMIKSVLRSLDAARSEATGLREAAAPATQATETAPAPSGDFEWDTSAHWKKREMIALNDHGNDPATLLKILAAETSAGVKKAIQARLDLLKNEG